MTHHDRHAQNICLSLLFTSIVARDQSLEACVIILIYRISFSGEDNWNYQG